MLNENLLLLNMINGLGSQRIKLLLEFFKTPEAILKATKKELCQVAAINPELAGSIIEQRQSLDLDQELKLIDKAQVKVVDISSQEYPRALKEIYDAPIALYVKGDIASVDDLALAMVGSRRASYYGISTAERLGFDLAQLGITVVSGLARGIDTSAHRGSLRAKGRTLAVLGSGLNNIYPAENKKLAEEISESGAVISEFPMNTAPLSFNFPRRNRIISGLSKGVIVVEAAKRSGALITADCALEQGREVFAVPGKMDSATSCGSNNLIKQGAKLIQSVDDIIEELNIQISHRAFEKKDENRVLQQEEKDLLNLIDNEPVNIDQLMIKFAKDPKGLSHLLLKLQMKHLIRELPGKNYARVN